MESNAKPTLRVGQLAKKVGKTVRTIHFYEELGLLEPVSRSKGGFRQYDEESVTRVHWIDRLQQLNFSLTDIQSFLVDFREFKIGPEAMGKLQHFYMEKLQETRSTIEKYQALEKELSESLQYLHTCACCAPDTPRTACHSCAALPDGSTVAPVLVAALHESA